MICSVIIDVSSSEVDRVFDYRGDGFVAGQRVAVNFAGRITEGYIIAIKDTTEVPNDRLKDVLRPLDDFVAIDSKLLSLGEYMRKRYHLRYIDVLRLFVPAEMRRDRVKELFKKQARLKNYDSTSIDSILRSLKPNAVKQRALVTFLFENGATLTETLNLQFGSGALASLTEKGFVELEQITVKRTPYAYLDCQSVPSHILTETQQKCVETILSDRQGRYLVHGVTGSGKTEIYLNVIERLAAEGKTCIMLVPEISLTPNMLRQLRGRFGDTVALLHSGLSVGERYDEWLRLKRGEALIAVGARSAVFAPLNNIGAIIIDEEHDSSYISDFNPRYNTAEIAEFRRKSSDCMLILGSATPSLTSYRAAQEGSLKLLVLPERINKKPLPEVEIADMAAEVRRGNKGIFSSLLNERLTEVLEKGNQAMLFLNRRGYSSFLMCTKCGYVAKCVDCDVSLTVHREDGELKCHYCNKRYKMLTHCPECHSDSFRQGKIGTQQIVELLKLMYPQVKILRMDADTTQNKEGHFKILSAFGRGEAQILVGTQMIAKGHDFPKVTLVGILDGDQSLYYSDYLSSERTFQLITQVSGRSGRDSEAGRVVLQTYTPSHYCLQLAAKQDYISFYKKEINLREASQFPPFSTIVRILYQGESEKDCIDELTEHYAEINNIKLSRTEVFYYLDKMRCPLKRAEKKYRFQILMKIDCEFSENILETVYAVTDTKKRSGVQIFIERDPQNLS